MQAQATKTVLIVDDSPDNLTVMGGLLQPLYQVRVANSGARALELAVRLPLPDLILLDIMMPGLDGYSVLARLRADVLTQDIPVIFVTGMSSPEEEIRGLEGGAADYITKPIIPAVLQARVRTQLALKHAQDQLRGQNQALEGEVASRMKDNEVVQEVAIRALAHLAETRDPETGHHILRTQAYVRELATALRQHPRFADTLTDRYIDLLVRSAPLHDIGKVGVPDAILLKPGPLTALEWRVMKTHAAMGSDAITRAEQQAGKAEFLSLAKEVARSHHEKWDGSGYPDALAGDAIPLAARIMAIADVFDALISVRVYKNAMSFEAARDVVVAGRGLHFDPDITDAFCDNFGAFCHIAQRYSDVELAVAA